MFNICYNNLALDLAVESFGNAAEIGLQFIQRITKRVINMSMPSQKELNSLFSYDKDTGLVSRITSPSNNVKIGDTVGTLHGSGYLRVRIYKKDYFLHRVIWMMEEGWLPEHIDHKDRVRDNNKKNNLRPSDHKKNSKNLTIRVDNVSGVTGVHWHTKAKKWQAGIKPNDTKFVYLGLFNSFNCAAEARKKAEIKYGFYEGHGT